MPEAARLHYKAALFGAAWQDAVQRAQARVTHLLEQADGPLVAPLLDAAGRPYEHFTRAEVFGAPFIAGMVVSVDPSTPEVFRFRPYELRDE